MAAPPCADAAGVSHKRPEDKETGCEWVANCKQMDVEIVLGLGHV